VYLYLNIVEDVTFTFSFIQVFATELVTFAVDFVPLAVKFGTFAVEFIVFALEFLMDIMTAENQLLVIK